MDPFPIMKEYLKKFNYPKIHSLDDVQIADIFHGSNRQFLVCWILKNINTDYSEIVDKATKEDLGEILYCNGLCTDSEKNRFMNGECDATTQLNILSKLFSYLDSLQEAKNNDETRPFSTMELQNLINFDTNLFPMFGSRRILNSTQRQNKIKDYQKEIEHLQNLTDSRTPEEAQNVPQLDPNLTKELSHEMGFLEANFPDFQRKTLDVVKDRGDMKPPQIDFKENFVETLENCDENAALTLNLIENMNIITNFKERSSLGSKELARNKKNNLMGQVAELCNDLVAASRRPTL